MSSVQDRDYYRYLFTPESSQEDSLYRHTSSADESHTFLDDLVTQGQSIINNDSIFPAFTSLPFDEPYDDISSVHDSEQEFPDTPSSTSHTTGDNQSMPLTSTSDMGNHMFNIGDPPPIVDFLEEEEMLALLG